MSNLNSDKDMKEQCQSHAFNWGIILYWFDMFAKGNRVLGQWVTCVFTYSHSDAPNHAKIEDDHFQASEF